MAVYAVTFFVLYFNCLARTITMECFCRLKVLRDFVQGTPRLIHQPSCLLVEFKPPRYYYLIMAQFRYQMCLY